VFARPQVAAIHPSSVNSRVGAGDWSAPFVAYHECVRTTKLYVRDATPAPLLALLAFCGNGARQEDADVLCIDGWLRMQVTPARAVPKLLELRGHLEQRVAQLVDRTGGASVSAGGAWSLAGGAAPIVRAVVALFRVRTAPEEGAAKKKPKKKGGIGKAKKGAGVAAFARRFGDRAFFDGGGGGLHDY